MLFSDKIEDAHINTFLVLADGIIHSVDPEKLRDYVDPQFPPEKLAELARSLVPSKMPGFRELFLSTLNMSLLDANVLFVVLMNVLSLPLLAPVMTFSTTPIKEMTVEQREALLKSWRDSPIPIRRRMFHMFHVVTMSTFARVATDLQNQAVGYPGKEDRETLYEGQQIDPFVYTMMEHPKEDGAVLHLPDVDVVIIGSGSASGVVAHTLSEAGHKCLVIEKGKYYPNSELNFKDVEGLASLYERGGSVVSADQLIFVLAGSTFGGGSFVNWSACLKTPFKVRKEWADDHGIDWAASEEYDDCMNYVWQKMGASTDGIEHSFTNQVILDGATKLGYKVKEVAQNSGGHKQHSCGFCHLGCKYGIKQGSVNCWFRHAAAEGCQFMDQARVTRIVHKGGRAVAVDVEHETTKKRFRITGPKKFIVAGGLISSPIVLQKSGFKNKHIGANLKLHPVTAMFGDFGKENRTNHFQKSILTTVCTESDDIDGKAHGAKIEAILHAPYTQNLFYPWNSSEEKIQGFLKYKQLAEILIITRDKGSGYVTYDPKRPDNIKLDYTTSQFDRLALQTTIMTASDILYVEGAKEIIHPNPAIKIFKSDKPKHERDVNDKDFVAWKKAMANFKNQDTAIGSAHQMSSCRMSGKGARHGACDPRGRLFECSNIYVADSSAMPTASGVNPMISTMAIARLVAKGVVQDLKPQSKL